MLLAALATIAAGCGNDGNGGGNDEPSLTSEEPTEGPPGVTSGETGEDNEADDDLDGTDRATGEIATAAYERAYSECGSTRLPILAGRYTAGDKDPAKLAPAVGRHWARFFKREGDPVVERSATAGCADALAE